MYLSIVHILVAVKVNDCKKDKVWRERRYFSSGEKVEKLLGTYIVGLKCTMIMSSGKLNFCFQGYRLKIFLSFALDKQALYINCRAVLKQLRRALCGGQCNLCLFGFSQGMLVTYNFNESNSQWFLIQISFLVCLRQ